MNMRALRALFLPMAHVCLFLHKIYLVVGIFYGLPTLHVLYAIAYGFAILNVVGIPGTTHLYPEKWPPILSYFISHGLRTYGRISGLHQHSSRRVIFYHRHAS